MCDSEVPGVVVTAQLQTSRSNLLLLQKALHAWLKDPEYAATIAIRIATTDNLTMFIADAIDPGD